MSSARFLILPALAAAASLACAQTSSTALPHDWLRFAALPPGTPLLVHQTYQRHALPCVLAWIDNAALACDTFDGRSSRVIYPAASVASVRRDTTGDDSTHATPLLIGMGVGALIGGLAGREGGAGGIAGGATLGAGAGGAIVASFSSNSFYSPPRPQFGVRIPLGAAGGHLPWKACYSCR